MNMNMSANTQNLMTWTNTITCSYCYHTNNNLGNLIKFYDVKTHIKLELSRAHTPRAKMHDLH